MNFELAYFQDEYGLAYRWAQLDESFADIIRNLTDWQQHYVIIKMGSRLLYALLGELEAEIRALNLNWNTPLVYLSLKPIRADWRDAALDNAELETWLHEHTGEPVIISVQDKLYVLMNPAASRGHKRPDTVFFTAEYPYAIKRGKLAQFKVYAHLARQLNELGIAAQAHRKGLETNPEPATIPVGTTLYFAAEYIPFSEAADLSEEEILERQSKVHFLPRILSSIWDSSLQEVTFNFFVDTDLQDLAIKIGVHISAGELHIPLADLEITVILKNEELPSSEHPSRKGTRTYYDVFICYARDDLAIVQKIVEMREKLKDAIYWDQSIRAGENFPAKIAEAIESCQVFALYWSTHSKNSDFVRLEYQHALKVYNGKIPRERFFRPYYWEDELPEVPLDLKMLRLHFERIDVDTL